MTRAKAAARRADSAFEASRLCLERRRGVSPGFDPESLPMPVTTVGVDADDTLGTTRRSSA